MALVEEATLLVPSISSSLNIYYVSTYIVDDASRRWRSLEHGALGTLMKGLHRQTALARTAMALTGIPDLHNLDKRASDAIPAYLHTSRRATGTPMPGQHSLYTTD